MRTRRYIVHPVRPVSLTAIAQQIPVAVPMVLVPSKYAVTLVT